MDTKHIIEEIISNYGYIGIFTSVMLEYANIPLPSEIILPFVGILSLGKNISLITSIGVTVLGGVLGSIINYYIGYFYGNKAIEFILKKYKNTATHIEKSYTFLKKNIKIALILSRIIPGIRTIISIVAGSVRISIKEFIAYSFIGILIWNSALILIGYTIGYNFNLIYEHINKYSLIVIWIVFLILIYIWFKHLKNKKLK